MSKKLLSWLLLCCMLVTVFPLTVLSVDTQTDAVTAVTDSEEAEEKKEFTVTFITDGKTKKVTVAAGETVAKPKDPKKGALFNDFAGWTTSVDGGTAFDFNTPITGDVTLYAHWGVLNTREISQWEMMLEETQKKEDEKVEDDVPDNTPDDKPVETMFTVTGDFQYRQNDGSMTSITYANCVLQNMETKEYVFGVIEDGKLTLSDKIPAGTYSMEITGYCGFEPVTKTMTIVVSGNMNLGTQVCEPETTGEYNTIRIQFIESLETKNPIKLSDIFTEEATFGIGRYSNHYDPAGEYVNKDLIDIKVPVFEFAETTDTEFVFKNVPLLNNESYDKYMLFFDLNEVNYAHPGSSLELSKHDMTLNEQGEYVIQVALEEQYLEVEGITVTKDNAANILKDGTAVYDYATKTLTLNNANLCGNANLVEIDAIKSNMHDLILHIPEGTTSYLHSYEAQAINSGAISITGKGTLHIACDPYYYAITGENCSIENTTIIFDGSSGGIHCFDLVIKQSKINNTGVWGYNEFTSANSISIIDSTIDITSVGGNVLWSHGGDTIIRNSDVTVYCIREYAYYLLFAEAGAVYIDNNSIINLVAPNITTDKDKELLCATNGIILGDALTIRTTKEIACEIYRPYDEYDGEIDYRNYSVKCADGTYPKQIFIATSDTPVPEIKNYPIPNLSTVIS